MDFNDDHIARIVARLGKETEAWLRTRSVEQHYSADTLAEILEQSPRTVWTWLDLYETSGGRDGIGPYLKLSHKNVRIPASSVNRFLRAKTIDAASLAARKEAA